jgi:peptidoglycan/LPS O-acetylase OafA/YrhL
MPEKKRLLELDALRGFAAFGVCLFHFGLFKFGVAGVDLFFVISGFVIYMSIINSDSIKDFIASRFIRLFPCYWLSISIAIIAMRLLTYHAIHYKWNFVLGNLLMLQPIFKTTDLVGAYWTLYVELTFYILMSSLWYFKQLKNIELIILAGLLFMIIVNGTHLIFQGRSPQYERLFMILRSLLPLFFSHFNTFSAGILFYIIYTKGNNTFRSSLLILSFCITAIAHNDSAMIKNYLNVYEHLISLLVIYIIFLLIIKDKLPYLEFKYLVVLGNISYVLYLIHQSLGTDIKTFLRAGLGLFLSNTIAISAVLTFSLLITYYFDIPLRRWLKKKYRDHLKRQAVLVKAGAGV